MKRMGTIALATSLSILGATSAFAASNTRVEQDAPTVSRGTDSGQSGYWVEYNEYTFQNVAALEELKPYTQNHDWDGITDWRWDWSRGAGKYHGDRDWNMTELKAAFGSFGWKDGQSSYGASGQSPTIAPQTARSLGQAYRFLKLAEGMEKGGITAIPDSIVFSIQADDGVAWDYSSRKYVNVDPKSHLATLPNIGSEFFLGSTRYNQWTSIRRYTITNLTPQLARALAKDLFSVASRCGSPIALDLNHDGRISVTGRSSAKFRSIATSFNREGSVLFDLEATGRKARYEWLNGNEDGFLVNDRNGQVTRAIADRGGEVDGNILFGSAGGFENGYYKLASLFLPDFRVASLAGAPVLSTKLASRDMGDLKVWIDSNHDARVQATELRTLDSLGITEIETRMRYFRSADGEMLMRSHYTQNGKRYMTEDVWFAIDPADASSR